MTIFPESDKGPQVSPEQPIRRDPRVDRWLANLPEQDKVYAGTEGLRAAFRAALLQIDARMSVMVTPVTGVVRGLSKEFNVAVAVDGVVLLKLKFSATEDNGELKLPSLTPGNLRERVISALETHTS